MPALRISANGMIWAAKAERPKVAEEYKILNREYLFSNAHTHSTYCDGKFSPEDMVKAALEKGFHTLGFSGHSPLPGQDWTLRDPQAYRAEVARVKKAYAGKINVFCGIEWDGDSPADQRENYDYVIGSVHRLYGPKTGKSYEADHKLEFLEDCKANEFEGDGLAMALEYLKLVNKMVDIHPDILGHMDLIRKLNQGCRLFDENAKPYLQASLEVLEKAARADVLVEINTGGAYRGYRNDFYPKSCLLPEFARMGGKLILTSDSHDTKGIGYRFEDAAEGAKKAGFKELYALTAKGFEPFEIV